MTVVARGVRNPLYELPTAKPQLPPWEFDEPGYCQAFPDWRTIPNQQIENWPAFQAAWRWMIDHVREQGGLPSINITPFTVMLPEPFPSMFTSLDGRMLGVTSTRTIEYDPRMHTVTTLPRIWSEGNRGLVPLPTGKVLVLSGTDTAHLWDYKADTLTLSNAKIATPGGSYGTHVGRDGLIYIMPGHTASGILQCYDPILDTNTIKITNINMNPGASSHGGGGALLPDGRMLFWTVFSVLRAYIYNPATNELTTPNLGVSGNSFYSNTLMPDGRVFIGPYTGTNALLYDPILNTSTTVAGVGGSNFDGVAAPLLDGRMLITPRSQNVPARVWDPIGGGTSITTGAVFPASVYDSYPLIQLTTGNLLVRVNSNNTSVNRMLALAEVYDTPPQACMLFLTGGLVWR